MKVPRYPDITPDQMTALHKYAAKHGRKWKDELGLAWLTGSAGWELHSLRNSHGPSWLAQFKFPE